MTDRFKFRAWDECNKIMHYDFQFIKSGDSGNDWIIFQSDKQELNFDKEKNFCINIYPNPFFAQQLKIMQCTGLKDKNGKLIYEGDVVTYDWLTPIGKVWRTDGKHIVEWNDGFTVIGNIAGYDVEHGKTRNIEVIGNIYENKDLLNDN